MLYRTFTTREKVLFVIFGILLLGAIYYFLVFRTFTDQKAEIQNVIYSQQEELSRVEARAMDYNRMKSELETLPSKASLKPIKDFDNVKSVMEFLNTTMASADDFNISFSSIDAENEFVRRTLVITYTCRSEETARQIIDQLFDAPYRSQVSEFHMSNTTGGCSVNMTLTFFELQEIELQPVLEQNVPQ